MRKTGITLTISSIFATFFPSTAFSLENMEDIMNIPWIFLRVRTPEGFLIPVVIPICEQPPPLSTRDQLARLLAVDVPDEAIQPQYAIVASLAHNGTEHHVQLIGDHKKDGRVMVSVNSYHERCTRQVTYFPPPFSKLDVKAFKYTYVHPDGELVTWDCVLGICPDLISLRRVMGEDFDAL